jgi:hypothetical protein
VSSDMVDAIFAPDKLTDRHCRKSTT